MNEQQALSALTEVGAVMTKGHFVYKSRRHGSEYVNKDVLYTDPYRTDQLCREIARHFCDRNIQVVVAPAIGGVALTQWVAYRLRMTVGQGFVFALYAEKDDEERFVFRRGYDLFIPGRRVLVVEDVLTTGGSAKKVVDAVRALGGNVVAVAALCNRGGVTADGLGVPELFSLTNVSMESWGEDECPLCKAGVPINTDVGHGREFVVRKKGMST